MQFGVGNTSETGSYVTPTPPTVAATTAVNNHDGTFNLSFSFPMTFTGPAATQLNWFAQDSTTGLWGQIHYLGVIDASTIICAISAPTADILAVILGGDGTTIQFAYHVQAGSGVIAT